jgi:hypothetical protein
LHGAHHLPPRHSTSSGHVGWLQESQAARQPTGPRKSTPARF